MEYRKLKTIIERLVAVKPLFEAIQSNQLLKWIDVKHKAVSEEGQLINDFPLREYFTAYGVYEWGVKQGKVVRRFLLLSGIIATVFALASFAATCYFLKILLSDGRTHFLEFGTLAGSLLCLALSIICAMEAFYTAASFTKDWNAFLESHITCIWKSAEFAEDLRKLQSWIFRCEVRSLEDQIEILNEWMVADPNHRALDEVPLLIKNKSNDTTFYHAYEIKFHQRLLRKNAGAVLKKNNEIEADKARFKEEFDRLACFGIELSPLSGYYTDADEKLDRIEKEVSVPVQV